MRWAGLGAAVLFACGGVSHSSGGTGSTSPASDGGIAGGDAGPADAGPYSGPDCNGIVPATLGTAYTFDLSGAGTSGTCAHATSDGKGTLAASTLGMGDAQPTWWEYDARGTSSGSFASAAAFPQAAGFIGVVESPQHVRSLVLFDQWGSIVGGGTSIDSLSFVAPAWSGGALVFSADAAGLKVRLFGADANEKASLTIAGSFAALGGAQDASGAVLAITGSGSSVGGLWVDPTKGTAGAPFSIGSASAGGVVARPLAVGGIAVRLDDHWAALLQPGDRGVHPAPAWLRDGSDFNIVRGDKAYTVVQGNAIDLVSTAGNLCGSMTFSGESSLSVGADGTLIGASGSNGCSKVFWRALLQ